MVEKLTVTVENLKCAIKKVWDYGINHTLINRGKCIITNIVGDCELKFSNSNQGYAKSLAASIQSLA